MPVQTNNLILYKSERLTDTPDGGGKYSGQVVVDGESNNLFPDVSELDRTMGRVSIRKIFAGINNNDTAALMGSTVFVSKNPDDPNVSALLFSTRSHTDVRTAAANRIESYLAKGGQAVGTLLDTAYIGMKSVQAVMGINEAENSVGDTLVLVVNEGTVNEFTQFFRITKVETRIQKFRAGSGGGGSEGEKECKIATYTFNDPLSRDFVGLSILQWWQNSKSPTLIRNTVIADSGKYYASVGVAQNVGVGSFTIQAKTIFSQLIPSSQTETPLLDLNAVSENPALVAGNSGTITAQFTTNVNNNQSLYIGSSVLPASVSFTLFGQIITDNGGTLRTVNGTQIGTIDYQVGHIVWTNAIGSGNAIVNITFTPAAAPVQPFESFALPVTAANQGTKWTGVLTPIPAPGALSISYMSQGKFYVIRDNGTGRLSGATDSIGSGSINYQTGTWLLTTGALPDVGTPILLQWGSPISTFARANSPVLPAGFDFQLFQNGITSLTATWQLEGETKTAMVDSSGQFTGDAIGSMTFNNGKGRIIPKKLPQKNTAFTLAYNYGTGKTQTVSNVNPDSNQKLLFTIGTGSAIQPSSVGLEIPVNTTTGSADKRIVTLHDVPIDASTGNLVNEFGEVQGKIIYATGACEVTPVLQRTSYRTVYEPLVFYVSG
ncbi:hypothetical protein F895_02594 [Acinetobacter sp. CIP 64.2]|uniref:hypothetical protein n=1 Tax=Acinetobacter sp. CIP 64.2 TaxID=1217694 RepID=UPI0002D06BE3|nr:hypothetical protein [Acinetobacter sp. CIP 64.2]ENX13290.1 hypothetical protein F895_02594 [Acinetobacter sp. CIP 64.2]